MKPKGRTSREGCKYGSGDEVLPPTSYDMALIAGRLLSITAVLTLLHAAFSTYENLSQLKALDKLSNTRQLSSDIVIELFVALFAFIIGTTLSSTPLKKVTWSSEMATRTADEMDSRIGFASMNHRGKNFFGPGPRS